MERLCDWLRVNMYSSIEISRARADRLAAYLHLDTISTFHLESENTVFQLLQNSQEVAILMKKVEIRVTGGNFAPSRPLTSRRLKTSGNPNDFLFIRRSTHAAFPRVSGVKPVHGSEEYETVLSRPLRSFPVRYSLPDNSVVSAQSA